jgi:hemoglobin-like flavoprotein
MRQEEIYVVKSSWAKVLPISTQAAEMFYRRLFDVAPELKALFKGDLHEQGQRLMHMINVAVNGLERWDHIVPTLHALGRRHAEYGVKDADYDAVASALLWTLEQGLGEAFTDDVKQAWNTAYTLLAGTMKNGAAEVIAA